MVNSIKDALRVLLWMAVVFAITGAIVVGWTANVTPSPEASEIFTYTEGGYECIVFRRSGSATCKEIK